MIIFLKIVIFNKKREYLINFIQFKEHFEPFTVFSIYDIVKWHPDFDSRRLVEWQDKGYIKKVINRWYCFADLAIGELVLYLMANRIYSPSYISFESALSYYGFIPEGVFAVHSATSLKTQQFHASIGHFIYRHIKPPLMFGIRLVASGQQHVRMADPEKALLDYLYLNASISSPLEFESMRLNRIQCKGQLDFEKWDDYVNLMGNRALAQRAGAMKKWINHA